MALHAEATPSQCPFETGTPLLPSPLPPAWNRRIILLASWREVICTLVW
jgi:hypothetical protein